MEREAFRDLDLASRRRNLERLFERHRGVPRHRRNRHRRARGARPGPVEEGNVGGGTGMVCFGFKGGIGTASRVVAIKGKSYTIGVLVQCNSGDRKVLRIAGAPVGQALAQRWLRCSDPKLPAKAGSFPPCTPDGSKGVAAPDQGSIIIVVGTDAPLMPEQLNRVARRASMGLARLGLLFGQFVG